MSAVKSITVPNFTQERLGIFIIAKETSRPSGKVPLYAEVVVSNELYVDREWDAPDLSAELADPLDTSPPGKSLKQHARLRKLTEQATIELVDTSSISWDQTKDGRYVSFLDGLVLNSLKLVGLGKQTER